MKKNLLKLFLAVFFLSIINTNTALATITALDVFTLRDGTPTFSANDNPGNDSSAHNELVRTNDEITYRFTIISNGGDTNISSVFSLPFITGSAIAADNGVTPAATWKQVPPQCVGASSSLSVDKRILTCNIGDLPNPSTLAIEPVAVVSGRAPNGQLIDFADPAVGEGSASISSAETLALGATYYDTDIDIETGAPVRGVTAADGMLNQMVSAAPRFDLMMGDSLGGVTGSFANGTSAHAFNSAAGSVGEDGLSLAYGVFMFAREIKGSEMLDPGLDVSFTHTLTPSATNPISQAALDAALLVAWNGPSGNQSQNLNPGCANGSLNFFHMPSDSGPVANTGLRNVANGGDKGCTQAQAGDPVIMTILGNGLFDTSLAHFPTLLPTGGGTDPTDNNEWYVLSKRFAQFIPLSLISESGQFSIDACVDFVSAPVSISGQDNEDPVPFTDESDSNNVSNNCKTDLLERTTTGFFSKVYVDDGGPAPKFAQRDPRIISDARVNHVAPGQEYRARMIVANKGSDGYNFVICDKIDNARQVAVAGMAANDLAAISPRPIANPPEIGVIEWGVQVSDGTGAGGISDSWGEYANANLVSLGGDEFDNSNNPPTGSGTLYESASCPDADPLGNTAGAPVQYFSDLTAVSDAGFTKDQVTMLRISGFLGAGQRITYHAQNKLRTSFKYDVSDIHLGPAGPDLVYNAGDAIPSGSHVANRIFSSINGEIVLADDVNDINRDVFEVNTIRYLRINKSSSPVSGSQVAPTDTITYTLQPNYTTPDLGTPANVLVTDILPPGLTYLATSSGPSVTVIPDTPAVGFTTLEWTIANATPVSTSIGGAIGNLAPIVFTARVNTDLISGDQISNWTTLADGGLDNPAELDCVYDPGNDSTVGYAACLVTGSSSPVKADDTVHTVSAPPGFQLFKEVIDPVIHSGAQYTHRVNWASIGIDTPDIRVIDILPNNGDTRGTSFNGTMTLNAATPVGDLVAVNPTIYYTNTAPGAININPFHAANTLGGGSIWCIAANFGTAGCPDTIADTTAVLVDHDSQLSAGITYSVELTFNTLGNEAGDQYDNSHSADDSGVVLNTLIGNIVETIVVQPSLGNLVWHDYNGDGIQNAGEPGLGGVTLTLTGNDINGNPVNLTTTTTTNGSYLFDGSNGLILPSDATGYTVMVTAGIPAGLLATFDLDDGIAGADGSSGAFALNSADNKLDVDFGYALFNDIIINKTVVGEASTSPWVFNLGSDVAGCVIPNAVTNPENTPTGDSGQVVFANLPIFSSTTGGGCRYEITETIQAGWTMSALSCSSGISTIATATVSGIEVASEVTCEVTNSRDVDISVDKVLTSSGSFHPGSTVTYTMTIENIGPTPATDIVVADTMTNLTLVSVSGGTCAPANTFNCTIPSIASGNSEVLTVTATIIAEGEFDNAVTVTPAENDTDPSNNTDNTGNNGKTASVDVSVSKVLTSVGPFNSGDNVTYTVTVANAGPDTATNIVVVDTMTNLSFVSVTGGSCTPAGFPCTIPAMGSGASEILTVTAKIIAEGEFDNAVTVTPAENDTDPSNNTDNTGNNGKTASVDVSVSKVLTSVGPFNSDDTVTYTMTVANAGPDTATNIVVVDTMTNLSFVSVTGGSCTPAGFPCTIPAMGSGASEVLIVTAKIIAEGEFDNAVTVTPAEKDSNPSNNTDNTGNKGNTTSVDVSVVKVLTSSGEFNSGDTAMFTITIANAGPDTATNIVVVDTMTNLSFDSFTGGSCTPDSFPCTIPTLASGDSEVLTVTTTIIADGFFDNAVTVTPEENDTDPSNNTNKIFSPRAASTVNISVDKELITTAPYHITDIVTYSLTIFNDSPNTATGIAVADLMTNLTLISLSGGTCAPVNEFPCTIPSMEGGGSETLTVTARITAATFDNTVTVTPVETDTDITDNEDKTNNGGVATGLIPADIPTLSRWSLMLLVILIWVYVRKKRMLFN